MIWPGELWYPSTLFRGAGCRRGVRNGGLVSVSGTGSGDKDSERTPAPGLVHGRSAWPDAPAPGPGPARSRLLPSLNRGRHRLSSALNACTPREREGDSRHPDCCLAREQPGQRAKSSRTLARCGAESEGLAGSRTPWKVPGGRRGCVPGLPRSWRWRRTRPPRPPRDICCSAFQSGNRNSVLYPDSLLH